MRSRAWNSASNRWSLCKPGKVKTVPMPCVMSAATVASAVVMRVAGASRGCFLSGACFGVATGLGAFAMRSLCSLRLVPAIVFDRSILPVTAVATARVACDAALVWTLVVTRGYGIDVAAYLVHD